MLTNKKKITLLLCICLITFSYAKGSLFEFSVSPVYKLKKGTINENTSALKLSTNEVEISDEKDLSNIKLTDLFNLDTVPYSKNTWNLNYLSNFGLNAFVSIGPIALDATATIGIPQKSGNMTSLIYSDSENLFLQNITYDNKQLKSYFWDVKIVGKFDILNFIILRPYLGFNYNFMDLQAINAVGNYYESGNSTPIELAANNTWTNKYNREDMCVYLGLKTGVNLFDRLSVTGFFDLGIFNYTCSKDYYSMNINHYYMDKMFGFFSQYNFGLNAEVRITKIIYIGAEWEYTILKTIKGFEYEATNEDADYKVSNKYLGNTNGNWNTFGIYAKIKFAL